jgi:hypothetical protein
MKSLLTAALLVAFCAPAAHAAEAKIGSYSAEELGVTSSQGRQCVAQYNKAVPTIQAWADATVAFNNARDAMQSPADMPPVAPMMMKAYHLSKQSWSLLTDFDSACGQQYLDVSGLMGLASREILSIENVMPAWEALLKKH